MLYKAGYEPVLDMKEGRSLIPSGGMKEGRSLIPSGGIEGSDAVGTPKGNFIAPLWA